MNTLNPIATLRQAQTLHFVIKYAVENGLTPTLQVTADHLKITVPAVQQRIDALVSKGYLDRVGPMHRIAIKPKSMQHVAAINCGFQCPTCGRVI